MLWNFLNGTQFSLVVFFLIEMFIQVRQVVATIIFLKGVGGILFVFGSTFGSFLLVNYSSYSLRMNRDITIFLIEFSSFESFDIPLVLKYITN